MRVSITRIVGVAAAIVLVASLHQMAEAATTARPIATCYRVSPTTGGIVSITSAIAGRQISGVVRALPLAPPTARCVLVRPAGRVAVIPTVLVPWRPGDRIAWSTPSGDLAPPVR